MIDIQKHKFIKPTQEQCIAYLEVLRDRTKLYDEYFSWLGEDREHIESQACIDYLILTELIKIFRDQEESGCRAEAFQPYSTVSRQCRSTYRRFRFCSAYRKNRRHKNGRRFRVKSM